MNLIVAVDKEWGIGNKGDLLVRIRADLKHFAELTSGKIVILGSNTLATFPGGRVLKNRVNIVLHPDPSYAPEGAIVVHSIPEAVEMASKYDKDDVFVIGGASVYRQMLPYCHRAFITTIDKSFEKDTWIPDLDESPEWELKEKGETRKSDPETDKVDVEYAFCVYERVKEPAPQEEKPARRKCCCRKKK